MPRSKAQNEAIRAERRKAILDAAIPLFVKHGFSQTNISEVAKAAGVSHGTVFLYFPTKEALFEAALREPLPYHLSVFREALAGEGTPLERIRRTVVRQVRDTPKQEGYLRLTQYVLTHRDRFTDLAQDLYGYSSALTTDLVPVIRAGQEAGELGPGDPYLIAWNYFSWLMGTGLVLITPADDCIWERIIDYGLRIFGPTGRHEE